MNIEQAVDYIHGAIYTGKKDGLKNTEALISKLNLQIDSIPAIHVAGTNGKGSICAMLSGALMGLGLKVGLFSSPYLQKYNERIRINGEPVSDEWIIKGVKKIQKAANELSQEGINVTTFEIGTVLAFWIFIKNDLDVMILEAGLGGRFDSTNVIRPKTSVISTISYDHMSVLGSNIEDIAYAKAGIIKKDTPVIVHPQNDDIVKKVLEKEARLKKAPIIFLEDKQIIDLEHTKHFTKATFLIKEDYAKSFIVPLAGDYQSENALTALKALNIFLRDKAFKDNYSYIKSGLQRVCWPGRLEYIYDPPYRLLLDGAHNLQGILSLKNHIHKYEKNNKIVMIVGMLKEKMTEDILKTLAEIDCEIITVTIDSPRTIKSKELSSNLKDFNAPLIGHYETFAEALKSAQKNISNSPDGLIIILGSLYLIGEVRNFLKLPANILKQGENYEGDRI